MTEIHAEQSTADGLAPLLAVEGPSCWTGIDLMEADNWQVDLSVADRNSLMQAARQNLDRDPIAITAADFPLGPAEDMVRALGRDVVEGRGFVMLRTGLSDLDEAMAARLVWGLGQHLGIPQVQDGAGTLLHDIRDIGADLEKQSDVRIYQTNRAQAFHNDGGDMFALFCRRQGTSGGRSLIASAHRLWNEILDRAPDLARVLTEPFYFDARGQALPGRPWVQKLAIFHFHQGRCFIIHKRPYIDLAQRNPDVPRLSDAQVAALDLLDALCDDPAFHLAFDMQPGDLVVANNFTTLHARTAFDDGGSGSKRHMLRLWLGVDGGVALPQDFADTREFGPLFTTTHRN